MKLLHLCAIIAACLNLGESYSKYGRSCKDIGCLSNEVCVMETDPCSYYQRQNECGSYPTCKKMANSGPRSCSTYVCPPTKVCKMDGSTPKCVDDHSQASRVGYDTSANNDQAQGGNLYPNIPRGETTPRPNIGYQPAGGQGYQGGQVGSGYPGQSRPGSYPQQPSQYPQQPYPGYNGYPGQQGGYGGYPQQGGGYPQQGGGYPQQGGGGYPTNYNNQRYPNNPYGQNRYGGQSSSSGGIVDSITNALKRYGTDLLTKAIANKIRGN